MILCLCAAVEHAVVFHKEQGRRDGVSSRGRFFLLEKNPDPGCAAEIDDTLKIVSDMATRM